MNKDHSIIRRDTFVRMAAVKPLVFAAVSFGFAAHAGDDKTVSPVEPQPLILQTQKDIPADYHKYFGQRGNTWRNRAQKIAKFDLDSDINANGIISNDDPADGGRFEGTPPGLILGEKEMTRVLLRLSPYRINFNGEIVVTLELEGINRQDPSGEFNSLEEEIASTGHVRVWLDNQRKKLLLDSRDPAKRVVEFVTSYKNFPYNLPIEVPRLVYVEGVKASPIFAGDVRLLGTIAHRSPDGEWDDVKYAEMTSAKNPVEPVPATAKKTPFFGVKGFRTSFDHILMTVQKTPARKEFINNNVEAVWIAPPGTSY